MALNAGLDLFDHQPLGEFSSSRMTLYGEPLMVVPREQPPQPLVVHGVAAGTGEASRQREQRRVLLAHVFSCMHPQCSYPQCAPMRRKLHALVRAASTTLKR